MVAEIAAEKDDHSAALIPLPLQAIRHP